MIKRQSVKKDKTVKLTFSLESDDGRLPASVLGDFNDWDPAAHPLRKRNNGTHSATVTVKQGTKVVFRYRSEDGTWFDNGDADSYEASGVGSQNGVIEV